MKVTEKKISRLLNALRLDTPIIALYDSPPDPGFEPMKQAKGRSCCFAYYPRWLKGETLVIEGNGGSFSGPEKGCPGMQNAFGLGQGYPKWMAHFLTDGKKGAPMGEGLKATPEIAQEFLDKIQPPKPKGRHILMGPLKLAFWDRVKTITFLVDPDRLSALMTLATYWSAEPDEITAPFSSGCGLMWRDLISFEKDRVIIGCTDIAMRKYLPPRILGLTVSPTRFERMVDYPKQAFLNREWWKDLMNARNK
jgi:hypothetical protein